MAVVPIKSVKHVESIQPEPDALFHEIKSLSDHKLQLTIGAVRRPDLPIRWAHPVSAQFPGIGDDEYAALRDDIRKNGQQKAIAMLDGRLWDGRARYDACLELGLIPKIYPIQRGDPVIYLLQRHEARYGLPRSPERHDALRKLHTIETPAWKADRDAERSSWIADARREFKERVPYARKCAVCGLSEQYSQAHHLLPLNMQFEIGVGLPIQDFEWLCHVHHKQSHRLISARLFGTRRSDGCELPAEYLPEAERPVRAALLTVFERSHRLYAALGGVVPAGNWRMLTP